MRFAIRMADDADRGAIAALLREMMPEADVDRRLAWLYDGNPAGRALTWLCETARGEIAGCTSFFPFRLRIAGAPVRGALGGDGFVCATRASTPGASSTRRRGASLRSS
jgi:hypothetical protein